MATTPMMGFARATVTPGLPPLRDGGVLSVANVIDLPEGSHALMGAEYLTDMCSSVEVWTTFCGMVEPPSQCETPQPAPDPEALKTFAGGPDQVEGDPFAIYAGVECNLQRIEEGERRARLRLQYGQGAQIDAHVWRWLSAEAPAGIPNWSGGSVCEAVGMVEEAHAQLYGGRTTILVPRRYISCLAACGIVNREIDGSLRTYGGSLVAPITRALDDDTVSENIIATGQITILRGPERAYSVGPMVRADGTCEPARSLAERIIVPLVECAVVVSAVTCCCGETATP